MISLSEADKKSVKVKKASNGRLSASMTVNGETIYIGLHGDIESAKDAKRTYAEKVQTELDDIALIQLGVDPD